jgi:hypothetical protein
MNTRYTTSGQQLRQALADREEALATLLERTRSLKTLPPGIWDGKPVRAVRTGGTSRPVVRMRFKDGGALDEVLDIQLRGTSDTSVERLFFRCLAVSSREGIESTPRDFPATWHAAQLFAAARATKPERPKMVRIQSAPAPSRGKACRVCGRRKLTREEYNWRRRNGYAVWRCQHRWRWWPVYAYSPGEAGEYRSRALAALGCKRQCPLHLPG